MPNIVNNKTFQTIYDAGKVVKVVQPEGTPTTNDAQIIMNSLSVGTRHTGDVGEIKATKNITAYYSDERLKVKVGEIDDALSKVRSLTAFYYHANHVAEALGYDTSIREVGVSAQEVQLVQPEAVAPAPVDPQYLTVRYERLVPLLIEAIKELDEQVQEIRRGLK